jgi:hypothetical protein
MPVVRFGVVEHCAATHRRQQHTSCNGNACDTRAAHRARRYPVVPEQGSGRVQGAQGVHTWDSTHLVVTRRAGQIRQRLPLECCRVVSLDLAGGNTLWVVASAHHEAIVGHPAARAVACGVDQYARAYAYNTQSERAFCQYSLETGDRGDTPLSPEQSRALPRLHARRKGIPVQQLTHRGHRSWTVSSARHSSPGPTFPPSEGPTPPHRTGSVCHPPQSHGRHPIDLSQIHLAPARAHAPPQPSDGWHTRLRTEKACTCNRCVVCWMDGRLNSYCNCSAHRC